MNSPLKLPRCAPVSWGLFALFIGFEFFLSGCVSSKYRAAKENTPPAQLLNVSFASASLQVTLNTVITYNGPGSWKRNAFWDEYVFTFSNTGSDSLTLSRVVLRDIAEAPRSPGVDPWALEKESKTLEQVYRDAGIAFVRYTAPGVILVGAGAGFASAALMSAGAATGAAVCLVALPVYYISVVSIDHHNKVAMGKEFQRRRLVFPLTLTPGETRTGSVFFPMVPSPRSIKLDWSAGTNSRESAFALEFLSWLHVENSTPAAGGKK